jgi:hypothetical protein
MLYLTNHINRDILVCSFKMNNPCSRSHTSFVFKIEKYGCVASGDTLVRSTASAISSDHSSQANGDNMGTTTSVSCRICNAVQHPVNDLPFLQLGRGHYCSIACLRRAMAESEAEQELNFKPDTRNEDQKRYDQAFVDGLPRLCSVCCGNVTELQKKADEAQQQKPGAYYDVIEEAEARYPLLADFLGAKVCSLACARQHLATIPYFDAKGYWQSPDRARCAQCNALNRNLCDQSFAHLLLTEGMAIFCSSACLLAFLYDEEKVKLIEWKPYIEAVEYCSRLHNERCGLACTACGKHGDLPWLEQDETTRELERQASELESKGSFLEFEDPERNRLFREADGLVQKAHALLKERYPAYREPFLIMGGGFGPPTDSGAVFCSVECVRALFGSKKWRGWNAKGAWSPRPDGLVAPVN